jgi:hypothetical protein
MALGKEYQAQVKDAGSVLVGVSQVRVGKPSVRDAGTAAVKGVQFVGTSTLVTDTSTGASIDTVKVGDMSTGGTLPTGCTLASAGTYTGAYDGCFIIRAVDATHVDIISPNGYKSAGILISTFAATPLDMKTAAAATSGATIQGVPATTITAGMTWIVPVWSGSAQNKAQTGITSPYSMFSGSNESVGGLKDSSFNAKLDSIKTLESGFPAVVADRVIEKTSVDIKFSAYEFKNANIAVLKNMMNSIINNATMASVPVEVVCSTRGGSLVTFWCPSCNLTAFPTIAPGADFSTLSWELGAAKMTEVTGETDTYNIALQATPIYAELEYKH